MEIRKNKILTLALSEAWDELNEIYNEPKLDPNDFKDIPLNTNGYFEHLNHCIDVHGRKRKRDGATHTHHIYPISIGGKDVPENTIDLTFFEHLKAHKILADNNPDNYEMQQAYLRLLLSSEDGTSVKERIRISKRVARLLSMKHSGENNPNYGNQLSDEQKQKISTIMRTQGNFTPIQVLYTNKYKPNESGKDIEEYIGSRIDVANFLNFKNGSSVTKICNGERDIPDELYEKGVISIKYLEDPDKPKREFQQKRNVIGLDKDTLEIKFGPEPLADAARQISEIKTGTSDNFNKYKGGIQKSCARNGNPGKLSYKLGFDYYWFYEDEYKPQFKSAIARTMQVKEK